MTDWIWLDEDDAIAIHHRSLVLHGGASGVRDQGLLSSAMARPQQLAAYEAEVDTVKLAAAYTSGLLQNHPFVDGNKRTGFIIGILFLELNGLTFFASEEDAIDAVIGLASGQWNETAYEAFLREYAKT